MNKTSKLYLNKLPVNFLFKVKRKSGNIVQFTRTSDSKKSFQEKSMRVVHSLSQNTKRRRPKLYT